MAIDRKTVDYIVDQGIGAGVGVAKRNLRKTGLYCDGEMLAIVGNESRERRPLFGRRR
jgi:hypothetical protein